MKHQAILLALSLSCYLFSPLVAVTSAEEMVEIAPALRVSQSDFKVLQANQALMLENQATVNKILAKENLDIFAPVLPKTHIIATNSIHAMLNQVAYTHLAHKLGAPMPERPELATGSALINNRFLHSYSNLLLRSIAEKIGCPLPAQVELGTGTEPEKTNLIILQNNALLKEIGAKTGAL